ncbi:MAG TPA: gamma-glutamyl-gamma-aminobutyrate hydrolase family protein, partial [Firmicutes bacterium]|nr:gamma-glutamyl-gamma-aminobutyrate hydrolase family protein [Bacillota bacterium]
IVTGGAGNSLPPASLQQPYLPGLREQNPERYVFDACLIKQALKLGMPLVGICRGNQMLNEVRGGTIYSRLQTEIPGSLRHNQDGRAPWGEPWHTLILDPTSELASIFGVHKVGVNSLHHQAIHKVGQGLRAVAYAPDGVVEAIESEEHPFVFGLQFHPEKMLGEPFANNFFQALREAALDYKKAKAGRKNRV